MAGLQIQDLQSGEHHVRATGRPSHLQPHPKCSGLSALTMPVTEGSEFLPSLLCRVGKETTPARDRTGFLSQACAALPRPWRGASGR